jgi:predicted ATP-grasp superfamily ATP-dependent carboligase
VPKQLRISDNSQSVLLATGSSGGTIAAVRQLAKHGITVGVISSELLGAASWSRFASRSYLGPMERQGERFLALLLAIGEASPGQVLLPTSDETAWLYTCNARLLEQYFYLHLPSVETMRRIMDKNHLSEAAVKAGLTVLPTWESGSYCDMEAAAPTLLYPILIKPRTQVHRLQNDKGMVAYSKAELMEKLQAFASRERADAESLDLPDANIPLLQHFVDIRSEGVHSVSGYIDQTGELFVTRHARKVFQRSLPAGVGVCFESLPADAGLANAVHRLCRELGYFGIFEVEFIRFGDRWAVIDFNPRLFNQAGLDASRGMPLPLLAYLDAAGKKKELAELVSKSQETTNECTAVFYDRFTLWAILTAKAMTGRISRSEWGYWRMWARRHRRHSVDFAMDVTDPMPALIHAFSEIILGIRSFRRFLNSNSPASEEASQLLSKVSS